MNILPLLVHWCLKRRVWFDRDRSGAAEEGGQRELTGELAGSGTRPLNIAVLLFNLS